jgi:AraC family transcriptional regulator of adaptative response/methylated-DNA-[protein]-cysteine methyltransferase
MSDYERVEQIILYIEEHFRDQPDLATIAAQAGLSEFHMQRLFRRWAGISPKRFLQYLTAEYARARLQATGSVLEAAYDAGLSGPGRLHDLTVNIYAMTPGEVKTHGEGLTITVGFHDSPFGEVLIGITERGVCGLSFVTGDRRAALEGLQSYWPAARFVTDEKVTQPVFDQIFGTARNGHPPLMLLLKGTNFQVRVWEALLCIPPGGLVTYGDIAARLGQPSASRAVGTAVGQNPIAYLIPCHRVIRSTGVIGDYRWQPARKKAIIGWEAAHAAR